MEQKKQLKRIPRNSGGTVVVSFPAMRCWWTVFLKPTGAWTIPESTIDVVFNSRTDTPGDVAKCWKQSLKSRMSQNDSKWVFPPIAPENFPEITGWFLRITRQGYGANKNLKETLHFECSPPQKKANLTILPKHRSKYLLKCGVWGPSIPNYQQWGLSDWMPYWDS